MNLKKDQKDWKTTAGNIPDKNNKRKRNYKHNHRCSIVRHNDVKIENCWIEYFKFMETNLRKQKNHRESPHIVISKSFLKIKKIH